VKRTLSGSLKHLGPPALLRLLSATSPSGVLEVVTDAGSLRLEVAGGRVKIPTAEELRHAGRVLRCTDGAFRFEPRDVRDLKGDTLSLTAFAEAAGSPERGVDPTSFTAEIDVERLIAGDIVDMAQPSRPANIHVLPKAPLENPLDELLNDLETAAPGELLLTQVGVVAHDTRIWRGTLESGWRRRGWRLHRYQKADEVQLADLDILVLHQEYPMESTDEESAWIELIGRALGHDGGRPVIWVGRSADPNWIHRLIEAGVVFLMPPPHGYSDEALRRFAASMARVIDRQLRLRQVGAEPGYPPAVRELVETLLHGANSDQAVGSLLQLAAADYLRGAVLMVEDTAVRSRAGFGYPLNRIVTALPRGVGLLEKAIRDGEAVVGVDPMSEGARQLALVLGIERLPSQTAVIPLGAGFSVGGLLVVDREGQQLPALGDLPLLARCLGGAAVRPD
jgi:hypothetical protein